jgi:hypothetical protein
MTFDAVAKEFMLDGVAGQLETASLHSGDPGTGATNEVTGGGYARQAISFSAASVDEVTLDADVPFSTPADQPVSWFAVWRDTGGTVRWGKGQIVSGDVQANAAGEYTLAAGTRLRLTDPV